MSTFRTSVAEYWLTQIDQSFGLYHYDAHSAIAEFADLFKSTRRPQSVPANEKAIIVQERLRLACGRRRKESAALFDMTSRNPNRQPCRQPAGRSAGVKLTAEEIAALEEPYVPHPVVGFV